MAGPIMPHFLRPYAIVFALPWLAYGWMLLRSAATSAWQRVCDPELLPYLLQTTGTPQQRWHGFIVAVTGLCLTIACMGPAWHRASVPLFRQTVARIVILDLSQVMLASDVKPSRLARARYKILDSLQQTPDAQVGLIVAGKEPFVVSPLTTDINTITALLQALQPHLLPVASAHANLGAALSMAQQLLQRGGAKRGDVLIFTASPATSQDQRLARSLAPAYRVHVIGVGLAQSAGTPVPTADGHFLKDDHGQTYLAKLDIPTLQRLAAASGGVYHTLTATAADLRAVTWRDNTEQRTTQQQVLWEDAGYWFLWLALPGFLWLFRHWFWREALV